jgi:formate dehydrogenase iron-sulfur subunit
MPSSTTLFSCSVEVIDRIIADEERDANLLVLEDLCELMTEGSLCAMGGLTPMPVRSALRHFAEDFARPGVAPPKQLRVVLEDRHPAPTATEVSS